VCAQLLAKGHARSGDPSALWGYMGASTKFDKAIAKFAMAYADQTTKDYEVYKRSFTKTGYPKKLAKTDAGKKSKPKTVSTPTPHTIAVAAGATVH
jgi:hypothetical protein